MRLPFKGKKKKGGTTKTAVVEKEDDDGRSQIAKFDIKNAGDWAGDWIKAVREDLERRFGAVEVTPLEKKDNSKKEERRKKEAPLRPFKDIGKNLQHVSPMHVMNEGVKNKLKTTAKENSKQIVLTLIEAAIYCAAFNEAKRGLKRLTRNRKYTGPAVAYVSDVAMPNGLYGPVFGFLIRLALPF